MISENIKKPTNNQHMVQYGVWGDCCNNCEFCLRKNRATTTNELKIALIDQIRENIKYVDWKNQFSYGISVLGGELFYIKNQEVQDHFMMLVDEICDLILTPDNPNARFSTVTNGLYKPDFLYRVIDRIVEKVGIKRVDVNFSYDLKYRYANEKARLKAHKNINEFIQRYNYCVGIQMILTQNVINLWKEGKFDVKDFVDENFKGGRLVFLYPHPINTGKTLPDFNFNRKDFLDFVTYLQKRDYEGYINFINSTKNSGTFKYTGLREKAEKSGLANTKVLPILSDGKEEVQEKCKHSTLYQCYCDSDKCMLCDLIAIDGNLD